MNLSQFEALLTPNGQAALQAATALQPRPETFLSCLTKLQKTVDAEVAKAALGVALLRVKGELKFSRAAQMYFERAALEQSSAEVISTWRAQRFATQPHVADCGCGIGGDSLGLAQVVPQLTSIERDPLRLAMARENVRVYQAASCQTDFIQADFREVALPQAAALWLDPARRDANGKRIFSVEGYMPPLSVVHDLPQRNIGIKVSPAVKLDQLANYDCEVEFISHAGDLKEAVLWFGDLRQAGTQRVATLLPSGKQLRPAAIEIACTAPAAYLYEPDPAVMRAGAVTALAEQIGATKIDPEIALLTTSEPVETPFAKRFSVVADFPFGLKRTRAELRERNIGRITIKKRGSPIDVDSFAKAMKLKGPKQNSLIVMLTHVLGKPWVVLMRAEE